MKSEIYRLEDMIVKYYPNRIKEIEFLNYKELKVIRKLLSLGSRLDSIEQKEIFRLGMREMLVNLADMNLIPLNLK